MAVADSNPRQSIGQPPDAIRFDSPWAALVFTLSTTLSIAKRIISSGMRGQLNCRIAGLGYRIDGLSRIGSYYRFDQAVGDQPPEQRHEMTGVLHAGFREMSVELIPAIPAAVGFDQLEYLRLCFVHDLTSRLLHRTRVVEDARLLAEPKKRKKGKKEGQAVRSSTTLTNRLRPW